MKTEQEKLDWKIEYCRRSKLTVEEFDRKLIVTDCNCGVDWCNGFAVIGNTPEDIKMHRELYQSKMRS